MKFVIETVNIQLSSENLVLIAIALRAVVPKVRRFLKKK